jgi:hypothetical protein
MKTKYASRDRREPTIAPLTAAVGLALSASSLQAAIITVDTIGDASVAAGDCSLRQAFEAADTDAAVGGCNAGFGADQIVFDNGLTGTIALSTPLINVESEVTLNGPGAAAITISGSGVNRLFGVAGADADLTIRGVTLANAYADGSIATFGGAAIASIGGELSLQNCVVTGNTSANDSTGGAVVVSGANLSVENCSFSENGVGGGTAPYNLGGAILSTDAPYVSITDSSFVGNYADYLGGAITVANGRDVILDELEVAGNQAGFGAGGIALLSDTVATLEDSVISGNQGPLGGGLLVSAGASLSAERVEFAANEAQVGGGLAAGISSGSSSFVAGAGTVALSQVTLRDNYAQFYGGGAAAVYDGSSVIASASVFSDNAAAPPVDLTASDGGTIASEISGTLGPVGGGALMAGPGAEVELSNESQIVYNQAGQGGGILAVGNQAVASVSDTRVAQNEAATGGGMAAVDGGALLMFDSNVENNTAINSGGGILVDNDAGLLGKYSAIVGNEATTGSGGGFAAYNDCDLVLFSSSISGNTAEGGSNQTGGGIAADCSINIQSSTIARNTGSYGGGLILSGNGTELPQLTNSTITDNTGTRFGGLVSFGLEAEFVTISHNAASGSPVASAQSSRGIPLEPAGGALLIGSGGEIDVDSSIFADNIGPSGPNDLEVEGSGNLNYSLVEAPGSGLPTGTGNLLGVDPGLGPLADNGGDTRTRALDDSSPAIDSANPSTSLNNDQRGDPYPREAGGRADMGAFELFDPLFSDRFQEEP